MDGLGCSAFPKRAMASVAIFQWATAACLHLRAPEGPGAQLWPQLPIGPCLAPDPWMYTSGPISGLQGGPPGLEGGPRRAPQGPGLTISFRGRSFHFGVQQRFLAIPVPKASGPREPWLQEGLREDPSSKTTIPVTKTDFLGFEATTKAQFCSWSIAIQRLVPCFLRFQSPLDGWSRSWELAILHWGRGLGFQAPASCFIRRDPGSGKPGEK